LIFLCTPRFHTHSKFQAKYPIVTDKGTIDGVSIKLQFNQGTQWTKALKYLLTTLKLLLVWSSSLS
jgi:hypothetical protein